MRFWRTKKPQEILIHKVRFVGGQDGAPERILKAKLLDFFRSERSVAKAYLVRADLGEGQGISVLLALLAESDAEPRIVKQVGPIFASVFNRKEHLDIMFLTDAQESELKESWR